MPNKQAIVATSIDAEYSNWTSAQAARSVPVSVQGARDAQSDDRDFGVEARPVIGLSPRVREAAEALREFLFERVYDQLAELEEARRAKEAVRLLYSHYLHHPEALPPEYLIRDEPLATRVVDYIAGMTDPFALRLAQEIAQASFP